MKAKMLTLIAIFGLGMVAMATHSGGGDAENGYYWWNDNYKTSMWSPSGYLGYPQQIPWKVDASITNSGLSPYDTLNGVPHKFTEWYELRNYGDTLKAGDGYWLGVIINLTGNAAKGPIKLTHGGKIPPELNNENNWQNLVGDAWFWWFGRVYKEVAISTDGWAAFNSGSVSNVGVRNPQGKLPESEKPNATFAPYWYDFETDQPFYGSHYWIDPSLDNYPNYVFPDSGAVLYGWRWYVVDAYSSALDAADTTWPTWDHGLGMPPRGHVYVPVPVFIIEWCDVQKASEPNQHYTFQAQLINPVLRDTNWAKFVGRLGRPGIRKSVAEEEVANMWFYQFKCLIPQQVIFFYHHRSSGAANWPDNKAMNYDLVGIEDEDGVKGLTANYALLSDRYKVKFDYFKRCYEDLGIQIVNPPFNIVLRYTNLRPVVYVSNFGRNSAVNAPIEIEVVDTVGNQVYYDSRQVNLTGLGTDRWRVPKKADGTADTFRFAKNWKPGEIGTQYTMTARVVWGLDNCVTGNNIDEKDLWVHCDDTLAWHDKEPDFDWCWTGGNWLGGEPDYTISQDFETFIPWGGSQIGFSWVKGYGAWIAEDFPDDGYGRFEMTLIRDNVAGIFEAGEPDRTGPNSIMYPPLSTDDSYDADGWFDINDLATESEGPPGQTKLTKNIGSVWYTEEFYLGDSLAKGAWHGGGDADGWVVYWTGEYTSEWLHGVWPPGTHYIDALSFDVDGRRINPYWDLTGFGWYRGFNDNGLLAPEKGIAWANWFFSMPYLLSEYPETQPCHPMIETYIHTGTYDATLYQIVQPGYCDAGLEPGYYIEANTPVDFRADIANIGREELTNTNAHPFWVYWYVYDANGDEVAHDGVGITSLGVGDHMTANPPKWASSGDAAHGPYKGDTTYDLVMFVNFDYPGLHGADHCPYNDTIRISFKVLWTYDIACTQIVEPENLAVIDSGEMMPITAVFKNVGINDTINIPITAKVYNAGDETPPESLLAMYNYTIPDLNWRCSPAGAPDSIVYHFGDFKVPPTTIPDNDKTGRYMKIECRVAETWMDDNPNNDYLTVYVNVPGTGVEETARLPKVFSLSQVLPNPIASSAVIKYDVPYTSRVSLRVYDISGKLVRTLVDGKVEAGYRDIVWDGLDNSGKRVAKGIYFVRMDAPKYTSTRKLVIVH